jgi:cyclophilin family peptidyl-prolyl cis-trans isomerase
MLENAIAHLKGEEAPEHVSPVFNHPIERSRLNRLANGQLYMINTSRGIIKMRTFVDETPGSALAFDSLVSAGYYDGKSFHRVVPNFVAQGGCPRGDGYGSMDWTLRTEIGLSRYRTGSVGLASAGADTESCQFFFTHSPTPHLDGRYTRFGQVVEGMEIVNNVQVGDTIISIMKVNG